MKTLIKRRRAPRRDGIKMGTLTRRYHALSPPAPHIFAIHLLTVLILATTTAFPALPQVVQVDAQPLLLLTQRLTEALQTMGSPLSADQTSTLTALNTETDDAKITAGIQRVLDPLCVATVELGQDTINVTPGVTAEVEENGWRTMLVKVLNHAGVQTPLYIESPNARPIPHGPQNDIVNRWMSLSVYNGRPMNANLSGLGLEYRILQISSTRPGERMARIEFTAELPDPKYSSFIRKWHFGKDADGWGNLHDLAMEVRDNAMQLTATGNDPYLSAPVQAHGGKMVLRFRGRTESSGSGQMFWWTSQIPQPDGQRQKSFQLNPGRDEEFAIEFSVEGDLRGVRLDPLQGKGAFRIDWISLEYVPGENGAKAGTNVNVRTVPSTAVTFEVNDADGTACMAAFEIRDSHGRIYPAQPKRLAPDFFFHPQIYRETGEGIRLPRGVYTVKCSHGPESIVETRTLSVGAEPL
ncbi:MAG: hypothetical protein V4710_19500, partial [Verrucomicrobiota bacterium]